MMRRLKFWDDEVMEFYCRPELFGVIPEPRPSVKYFPEWFKRIPPTLQQRDQFGGPSFSAKKCFPLIEAMSLGYMMPLAGDTRIITNNDCSEIQATNPPTVKTLEFHNVEQIGGKGAPGFPANPVKFINHWVIETAPGWSTLFIPPINHFNENFTVLGGLVDTDKYPKEVNFPAIWHTRNADVGIPAGTPIIQAIPIYRKKLPKKARIREATLKECIRLDKMQKIQQSRISYYTNELREKKN